MRGSLSLPVLIAVAALGLGCDSSPLEPRATEPGTPTEDVPLLKLTVTPAIATIHGGQAIRLIATTRTLAGDAVVPAQVRWFSTNEDVATVTAGGLVRGIDQGEVEIVAGARNAQATTRISVLKALPPQPK